MSIDEHAPLVLGWSDDQLRPVAEAIRPLLSPHLSEDTMMVAASIVRDVVSHHRTTGRATYYSRERDFYRPSRYRNDPRQTYFYVTHAADALIGAGLVEHILGQWVDSYDPSSQSAWAGNAAVSTED